MNVIFQYQTMMQTVLSGMAGNIIPAMQTVSYVVMVICLLLGIYEAYAKGGDTRQLAATVFKYLVVAFVVGNWTTFFNDLLNGFNGIAQYVDNSYGGLDLIKDWSGQLAHNWDSSGYNSIWQLISNGGAAVVNSLEIAVAYIIFPIAGQIFTLIYVFWGAIVFAIGPLVLALAPSRMVNSVAKYYAQNLLVWNCWSILYALCILLIPVIALVILKAEFGGVGGALVGLFAMASGPVSQVGSGLAAAGASVARGTTSGAAQGGIGGGTYRNMSTPPPPTPPRDR
jgi:hypothetical protein